MKVNAEHVARVDQNPMPCRNIAGISKNIGIVGSTYQNVDCAWAAMHSTLPVSRHSQRMPRIETNGSDTISAPRLGCKVKGANTMRFAFIAACLVCANAFATA